MRGEVMSEKKGYEPPPLGLLGMKLGALAKKVFGVKPKALPVVGVPSPSKSKVPSLPPRIWIYPYYDPKTKDQDPLLAVLKVPKHRTSEKEFEARLRALGVGLAVQHRKIVAGSHAFIAVVPRAEVESAAKTHPKEFDVGVEPKPRVKWTSAGCVVLDSEEDHDHVYVIEPSNNYGPHSFPKGTVDKGESVKQAAIREVLEETGLRVKILPGKAAYLGKFEGGFSFTHYFLAVRVGGSPHPTAETKRVLLVTWDEARRLFGSGRNKRDRRVADLAVQALKQFRK